jgi:hypothetical protein
VIVASHLRAVLLATVAITGCSTENKISVELREPAYIMYRVGDQWLSPESSSDGYVLTVEGRDDFLLLAVCDEMNGRFRVIQRAATVEDGDVFLGACVPDNDDVGSRLIAGQMAQAGSVWVGGRGTRSSTGPWPFELSVPDLGEDVIVATDLVLPLLGGERVVVKHEPFDMPLTLDLDQGAIETVAMPLDLDGVLVDEQVTTQVDLRIGRTLAIISRSEGPLARVMPNVEGFADHEQTFVVTASTEDTFRFLRADVQHSAQSNLELLPRIDDALTYGDGPSGASVSWSSLPLQSFGGVTFLVIAGSVSLDLEATHNWISINEATGIYVDDTAPGFDPAWTVSDSEVLTSDVIVYSNAGSSFRTTAHRAVR